MISGKDIVAEARTWLGTKYHHQGRLKKSYASNGGVDCIGLIMGIATELRLVGADGKLLAEFDETSYSPHPDGVRLKQFLDLHLKTIDTNQIKLGDVLLFKLFSHPQHVGIASNYFSGGIGIIHCYSGSGQVVEHYLSAAWQKMLVAAYRFSYQ